MNLIVKIEKVLKEEKLINISDWDSLTIDHLNDSIDEYKKILKQKLDKKCGIYAYFRDANCLYIGKGKPIINRLLFHLDEAHEKRGGKAWVNFFRQQTGKLTIYWKELDSSDDKQLGEHARVILEKFLQRNYKPIFKSGKAGHNIIY